jgi:hypothetical protein
MVREGWSKWRLFPDPREHGILVAPFGPGCYQLRDGKQLILYGRGGHLAQRMTSLLPRPLGCGTRNNEGKRKYVSEHIGTIEYRTLACGSIEEARNEENQLRSHSGNYLFRD